MFIFLTTFTFTPIHSKIKYVLFTPIHFSLTPKSTCYILNAQEGQQYGPIHAAVNIMRCYPYCLWCVGLTKHKNCILCKCALQVCSWLSPPKKELVPSGLLNIRNLMNSIYLYFLLLLKYGNWVLFHHCTSAHLKPVTQAVILLAHMLSNGTAVLIIDRWIIIWNHWMKVNQYFKWLKYILIFVTDMSMCILPWKNPPGKKGLDSHCSTKPGIICQAGT